MLAGGAMRSRLALALLVWFCGCADEVTAPAGWTPNERLFVASLQPLGTPRPSPGNALADDPDAAAFGHRLFFDTRFSANGKVACATCHDPSKGFADGLALAEGVATAERHAPTVLGAAWQPWQLWDGRADSLWMQALGPIENPEEHGFDRVALAHVVAKHHRAEYEALFGALPPLEQADRFPAHARPVPEAPGDPQHVAWLAMTPADREAVDRVFANFGKAIEAYERKLAPAPIALDRFVADFVAGDDSGGGHLDADAAAGLRLFVGKGGCVFCHSGPRLSNGAFHNIGLAQPSWAAAEDRGRYDGATIVVASPFNCLGPYSDAGGQGCGELPFVAQQEVVMLGAFKTPSLRNVARTAPYMHAGQHATLLEVVEHYRFVEQHVAPIGPRESFLHDLDFTDAERDQLVAFLLTLDAEPLDSTWATAPTVP